jgi:hypothetical protein
MFKHFLITRFNLLNHAWTTSKNHELVLTEKWLENRFDLFGKFCFPCVQQQTNRDFEWLVFFDVQTPDFYKRKIAEFSSLLKNFTPLYIDGMSSFLPHIRNIVREADAPYVITSRLDNDDCIRRDFIAQIQNQFRKQQYMAVDFIDGYTLQIQPRVKFGLRKQVYNPFISLIESRNEAKSVWHTPHASWKRERRVTRIRGERIWMSVIHFENKANEFVGYGKVNPSVLLQDFPVAPETGTWLISQAQAATTWRYENAKHRISSHWKIFYKDMKRKLRMY